MVAAKPAGPLCQSVFVFGQITNCYVADYWGRRRRPRPLTGQLMPGRRAIPTFHGLRGLAKRLKRAEVAFGPAMRFTPFCRHMLEIKPRIR